MSNLHPWQADVRDFHRTLGLVTGDYSNPTDLGGETLKLRIRLLQEEVDELAAAANALDIVETVDALVDISYICLGSFDVVGQTCRKRFGLLIDTGVYRGFKHFGEPAQRGLRSVAFAANQALSLMAQHASQGTSFSRWDLLDSLMCEVAHCFCALGIDPRAAWAEVQRSNMAKQGGPIDEHGKLQKPPNWSPPDIAGVLRAQGVAL